MATVYTHRVEAWYWFVETDRVRVKKDGTEVRETARVEKRDLFVDVTGGLDFQPSHYKVTISRRRPYKSTEPERVVTSYAVWSRPKIRQNIWDNPSGRAETWFKEGDFVKEESLTPEQFLRWLELRVGDKAEKVILDFLTTPALPVWERPDDERPAKKAA